ncbi:MAG: dienelactone hydrolase family protein [Abditibacteriales bacterium]|nr:dienelactone hydrolase family protein [Abditibacteriales bacterium]MDW8365607.1 dienelactone hydrolase family protein [Abditibacteriales bacterium]
MAEEKRQEESSALSRREFLAATGGALLAAEVLTAQAEITTENVTFKSGDVSIGGFLCRPKQDGKFPGVIVIHENRGITDYIADVTKQLAQAGYASLAVNLCSRKLGPDAAGGTEQAMAALRELTTEDAVKDLGAGVDYLKKQPFVRAEKIGCVGFCYGGRMSLLLACHRKDISACVVFYGRPADAFPLIPNLNAAVLANYGEVDGAIPVAVVKELEETLKKNGKTCDIKIYPGAGHAFHRPGGNNYKEDAAKDAWARTLGWFEKYLRG